MASEGAIVVTGGMGALGRALAAHLRDGGRRVVTLDRPGSGADTELDLLSPTLASALAAFAPLDGAVLVAGGWAGGENVHEAASDETYRRMMAMNLDTVHATLRAILPSLVAQGRGSVVVIGSRAAVRPDTSAGAAAYAASKAAAVALAEAVAAEVRPYGVRINAVLPSTIDTPANRAAMPNADPSRWVSPTSLAEVIAFLLSDASRDVSGAAIPVYGRS